MSTSVVLERLPVDPTGYSTSQLKHLDRKRVYIFPTSQGWVYALMLIVMLLGAINYNNSMAFILCFLLASLGLVCMLHTYRNLTGLIISSKIPAPVFAGQEAYFPLLIDNRMGITRLSLKIEGHKKNKNNSTLFINIEKSKQGIIYYPQKTLQRGIVKAHRLIISTEYPIGLFKSWSYFESGESCLVYPSPIGQKTMPLSLIDDEKAEVGIQTGVDDFAGFRKYHPGDPINSIAWKAFAREQGLLVKLFSGKGNESLILSWESVSHIPDIEGRLSQLCFWVLIADREGLQYSLTVPGSDVKPSYGKQHKERCLEILAWFGMEG